MIPLVSFSLGLACLWMSFVHFPFMLLLGFFLLRFFGQGSMTLGPTTLLPQWFMKKQGKAFSFMTLGGLSSFALVPTMNYFFIAQFGWRVGWRLWTILLWVIMLPLSWKLVRNRPKDLGLLPDGGLKGSASAVCSDSSQDQQKGEWTLEEAKHSPVFWFLLYCVFVPSMVNTGITFHLVSVMGDKGLPPSVAAMVLSVTAIISFPVTFMAGYLLDHMPERIVLGVTFIIHSLSILILLQVQTPSGAVLFGIISGVVFGMERMNRNVIWPNYFGRLHLGSISGYSMKMVVLGSALGPLPFGIAFDYFGGYTEIISFMLFFTTLAILFSFLASFPQKKEKIIEKEIS